MSSSNVLISASNADLPAAGWYPDPADSRSTRWWEGSTWTEHTRPLKQVSTSDAVVSLPTRRSLREAEAAKASAERVDSEKRREER